MPSQRWPAARALGRQSPSQLAALAGLAVAFGVVSAWNIGHAGYSAFYSSAARSMAESWRAFGFGAFDPGAHVTLDKLSGFLVPQALSARVFGFHPWSIALPQVIEGMVTVVVAYVIALRWKGSAAGLLAAAFTATTPLLVSMFGHVMEDGLLTMSLSIAFACVQSAILDGRLTPLLVSACWVAVGFQAKMMQAWLILPALAIGYLLGAPLPLAKRILRALLAGVVVVMLSLSWITAIQLVPARDRPYIDGTTNNNVYSMVFGYNGLNRLAPNLVPGAIGDKATPAGRATAKKKVASRATGPAEPSPPGGRHSKLVLSFYATQVGWLYPLAIGGLLLAEWPLARRRRPPQSWEDASDRDRFSCTIPGTRLDAAPSPEVAVAADWHRRSPSFATTVALGIWLLTAATFLTIAKIPHTAYFAAITVQIAVLASVGTVEAIRMFRSDQTIARALLPIITIAEMAWTIFVLATSSVAPSYVLPVVALLGSAASVLLVALAAISTHSHLRIAAIACALAVMLIAPTIWSLSVLSRSDAGSASEAYAGRQPDTIVESTTSSRSADPNTPGQVPLRATQARFRINPPFVIPHDPHLSTAQEGLARYVRKHTGPGPILATDLWTTAAPYILDDGLDAVPMGGFSGRVPTPSLSQFESMISSGRLRFVLLNTLPASPQVTGRSSDELSKALRAGVLVDGGGVGEFEGAHVLDLRSWIDAHCTAVPSAQYESDGRHLSGQTLDSCTKHDVQVAG